MGQSQIRGGSEAGQRWVRDGSEASFVTVVRVKTEYIEKLKQSILKATSKNYGAMEYIYVRLNCADYTNERGASEGHQVVTCESLMVSY